MPPDVGCAAVDLDLPISLVYAGVVEVSLFSFCRYSFPQQDPPHRVCGFCICVVVLCLWLFLSLNTLMRVPLQTLTHTVDC